MRAVKSLVKVGYEIYEFVAVKTKPEKEINSNEEKATTNSKKRN